MTRVNIWMEKDLHKQLKIVATLKGVTIQDYIEQAIEDMVKQDLELLKELLK